jgi:hypothetical protein
MEKNHDIRIEEIYIPSKHNKDNYLCEDFIIYPEGKEVKGGYLMGIIEIRATKKSTSEKIIQTIINALKNEYYRQITTSPDPDKLNTETVFEYSLKKANDTLTELIEIGQLNFSLENLNYLIAVAKPNKARKDIDFIFTQQGLISAYLLHKTKQNNFKTINIVENTPTTHDNSGNQIKIFSTLLSGTVYHHDKLYFCTELFSNFIPSHKVTQVITNNDVPTSIDYYKRLINNVKNNSALTYCSIFITLEEKRTPEDKPISQESMNHLIDTTEKTEKFLTPTLTLNFLGNIRRFISKIASSRKSKIKSPQGQKKVQYGFVKYLANVTQIILSPIAKLFSFLIGVVTGKRKIKKSESKEDAPKQSKHMIKKLFSLNKFSISILVVIVILGAVITASIIWANIAKEQRQIEEQFTANIEVIKERINNAQVSLIYKNESESLNHILEADKLVMELRDDQELFSTQKNALIEEISGIKNKLLKIEKSVPQLVTELLQDNLNLNISSYTKLGENNYSSSDNSIYKGTESIGQTQSTISKLIADDEELFALTADNSIYKVVDNSLTNIQATINVSEITDAGLYNGNIYALNFPAKTINKYAGTDSGFRDKVSWLKDAGGFDLSQATSLAIDGNIWVLFNDGRIAKYFSGVKEEFNTPTIEPKLDNPTQIFTALDYNNLYILNNKRVVIMSNTGNFIKQLTFDTLEHNITNIFVDEQNSTIYLTSANKLYQTKY